LVQHVEIDGCPVFRKLAFEKIREANDNYYKKMGLPKKGNTATTTDVIDEAHTANASCVPLEVLEAHTANASCVPSEVPEASPAPAGTAPSEVGKVSAAPARRVQSEAHKSSPAPASRVQSEVDEVFAAPASRVQSEVDNVSAAPASHVTPRDIMTDFETPSKEAEYEDLDRTFPALEIQKRGAGSTDSVATPMRPSGVNSPTKSKAEDDLIEMSPSINVPKRAWSSLAGLKPFNIAAGSAEKDSVRKENIPWEKEALEISPPPARPKFSGTVSNHSSASKLSSKLRSPMLTHAGPDAGALPKSSNVLQPVQELKLGELQLTAHDSASTPEEPAPKYYHKYDPDQPGFNLEQYRNPYSKKYNCAFAGCS
jgi:hypothetical protein